MSNQDRPYQNEAGPSRLPASTSTNPNNPPTRSTPTKRRRRSTQSSPESTSGNALRQRIPRRIPSSSSSVPSEPPGTPSTGADLEEAGEVATNVASTVDEDEEGEVDELDIPSDWTYELVVIQQPQRARACGFGDKDRRPISPPPIIRLFVRDGDGMIVEPSKIPIRVLVLLVDIWSADSQQQRNVVMHPSSTRASSPPPSTSRDIQIPYEATRRSSTYSARPTTGVGDSSWRWNTQQSSPDAMSTGPSPLTRLAGSETIPHALPVPTSPTMFRTSSRPLTGRSISYMGHPMGTQAQTHRPATAPSPARPIPSGSSFNLPPLSSITRQISPEAGPSRVTLAAIRDPIRPLTAGSGTGESSGSRPSWSTEASRISTDYSFSRSSVSASTGFTSSISSDGRNLPPITGWPPPPYQSSQPRPHTATSNPNPYRSPQQYLLPELEEREDDDRLASRYMDATFSRVLVGSLSCNCQRLLDENGNPGLFFFAHDLGIRTEGLFNLKFSLTNLSSMLLGQMVKGQSSPVLSSILSDTFTVYSAKKFPGVIPTTDLTRAFAVQGVKLPTRRGRLEDAEDVEENV